MSFRGMAACRAVSGGCKPMRDFKRARLLPYLEQTADASGSNQRIKHLLRPFPEKLGSVVSHCRKETSSRARMII
jgi:hypothetical protein